MAPDRPLEPTRALESNASPLSAAVSEPVEGDMAGGAAGRGGHDGKVDGPATGESGVKGVGAGGNAGTDGEVEAAGTAGTGGKRGAGGNAGAEGNAGTEGNAEVDRTPALGVGAAGQSGKLLVLVAGWGKSGREGGGQEGKVEELAASGGDRRRWKSAGREGKSGAT